MAGTLIAGSLTAFDVTADARWQGKTLKSAWWNSAQSRWDGLIPNDESGALSIRGDHWIAKDLTGTVSYDQEIEGRAGSAPGIYVDTARDEVHVGSVHEVSTAAYWRISYDAGSDAYTVDVSNETVTGMPSVVSGMTPGLFMTSNDLVWFGCSTDAGGLEVFRRTRDSSTWGTVTLDAAIDDGCVAITHSNDGSTDNVVVISSEDSKGGLAQWNTYYIDQTSSGWSTAGNWTEDGGANWDKTVFSSNEADNHLDVVKHGNVLLIASKTGDATTGEEDLVLWRRTAAGVYTGHEITTKQAAVANDRTRPVLAIDANGLAYIAYNNPPGDVGGWYRTFDPDNIDATLSAEIELFENGTDSFWDIRTPQSDFVCTAASGVLFLAEHATDAGAPGDDVWYATVSVAGAAAAARKGGHVAKGPARRRKSRQVQFVMRRNGKLVLVDDINIAQELLDAND